MNTESTSGSIYSAPESDTGTTGDDDLLAVYVGPTRAEYYRKRFEKLAGGGSIGWHWPAFFFTSAWLLYRKMWLYALLYIIVVPFISAFIMGLITATMSPTAGIMLYYAFYGIYGFILMPMFANRLYYGHARSKVDKVSSLNLSDAQVREELARKGGTSWLGFIFIVIPIIGILAAIAIPAYQDYTARAQVSEGLSLAGGAKTAVAEYFDEFDRLPVDNEEAGLSPPAAIDGKYTESVTITDGVITVRYGGPDANFVIDGKSLVLQPDTGTTGMVRWTCFSAEIPAKHLPAACRM